LDFAWLVDDEAMIGIRACGGSDPREFEAFCAAALPEVYGFLLARCGDPATAEDLTSETFMAALATFKRAAMSEVSVGWLIVVARRRLVDYWRVRAREERRARFLSVEVFDDAGSADLSSMNVEVAMTALARLDSHHRAALTLRYLDGLPVAQVACELGRGFHATEALLQRARRALRRSYQEVQAHA